MDVRVKCGDSGSNGSRDIQLPHLVTDEQRRRPTDPVVIGQTAYGVLKSAFCLKSYVSFLVHSEDFMSAKQAFKAMVACAIIACKNCTCNHSLIPIITTWSNIKPCITHTIFSSTVFC